MARKLPLLSGRKIGRILEIIGFELRRQNGSHMIFRRGSCTASIPDSKEVRTGTLRWALLKAGVSKAEFLSAYENS
ncbi:MAG: type II toxin-antitoxin system HicA family toxin [Gammaproteobacteria bacterium]